MVIAPQGGFVFENRIDLEIIKICFIYQTPIEFLKPREPRLCERQGQPEHLRSPIGAFVFTRRFKCR